jgi:hypothetical protein
LSAIAERIGWTKPVTQAGRGVAVGVGIEVFVGTVVGVEVGVEVAVIVGVMVAKRPGKLLHPDNKKVLITPHAKTIFQTAFEILRVSFMPFLLQ